MWQIDWTTVPLTAEEGVKLWILANSVGAVIGDINKHNHKQYPCLRGYKSGLMGWGMRVKIDDRKVLSFEECVKLLQDGNI